ncbi:hypothetical protein V6N13_121615 [Hibiscus sabdariffa]
MTGGSLGPRTWNNGSLPNINGVIAGGGKLLHSKNLVNVRKNSTKVLSVSGVREKERSLPSVWCRCLGCRNVSMLLLIAFALLVFVLGSFVVNKESISLNVDQQIGTLSMVLPYVNGAPSNPGASWIEKKDKQKDENYFVANILKGGDGNEFQIVGSKGESVLPSNHPCAKFTFPPPPPPTLRRIGPRRKFGFILRVPNIRVALISGTWPLIFVKGSKPGQQTGFDFDESDLTELQQFHDIIVASAIFGNYDVIQQPRNISEEAKKNIPFYMFIDEETEAYLRNKSILDSGKRVGLWRIVVVHNVPYSDARRNGKVPKLLLHRIFPNVRYSIWIDGKLQLVVDPYQILEKFLWRQNANFAISRHYRRFDVFVEAEANKAAGKYDNSSIDEQAYHRDLLETFAAVTRHPPALPSIRGRTPGKRVTRRGRDRRSGSRRRRKNAAGNRDINLF